jgi:hypothetical protein
MMPLFFRRKKMTKDKIIEEQHLEREEEESPEKEVIDALTTHFRRTSRSRIVDLPRWAQ